MNRVAPNGIVLEMTMPGQRVVYVNGRYVPEHEAGVSIFDSAMVFGDVVFEFARTFAHKPFRVGQHLERLYASMNIVRIDCGMSIDEMERITDELLARNLEGLDPVVDALILHEVSRGILGVYGRVFGDERARQPTVIVAAFPLDLHLAEIDDAYETGVHAVIPPQRSIPSRLLDAKLKTRCRQHYQIANQQAHDVDPSAFALLVDDDGFVTEGTGANFFMVKDGQLLTPEGRNVLRGVSRSMVFDLAGQLGIRCRQCNIEPYDAHLADEAFFTTTPFCLLGIARLNGRLLGDGRPGAVGRRLLETWGDQVGIDIAEQARYCAKMNRECGDGSKPRSGA